MTERWYRSRWRVALAAVSVVIVLGLIGWPLYNVLRYYDGTYVIDATGPLTLEEVEANFLSRVDLDLSEQRRECVYREVEARARAAGDPETLDPATVEMLPAEQWGELHPHGRRLVLAAVISNRAISECWRNSQ